MEQLMPNTYANIANAKSSWVKRNHGIQQASIQSTSKSMPTLSLRQRVRGFFTAERGDTLAHPQASSDGIIDALDKALAQHAVVSIMLNQTTNPFAKKLVTVTGTLRQDQGILTITNHATNTAYLVLPEQIRQICFGMMVA